MFPRCPNVLLAFVTRLCPNGFSTELCQSGCILIYLYFNAVNTHYFQYSWRQPAPLDKTMFRSWYGRCSISHWLSSWDLSQKPARLCSHHPSQVNPLLAQKSSSNLSSNAFSACNHICSGPNTVFSATSPLLHTGIESHHSHMPWLSWLAWPGSSCLSQTHSVLSPCHRNPPLHLVQRQPPDPWHCTHHLNTKFPYLHWALFQEGDLPFDLSVLGQSVFSPAWALLRTSSEQLLPCSGTDYPVFHTFYVPAIQRGTLLPQNDILIFVQADGKWQCHGTRYVTCAPLDVELQNPSAEKV